MAGSRSAACGSPGRMCSQHWASVPDSLVDQCLLSVAVKWENHSLQNRVWKRKKEHGVAQLEGLNFVIPNL